MKTPMTRIEDQIAELDALAEKRPTLGYDPEFAAALIYAWRTWLREAAVRSVPSSDCVDAERYRFWRGQRGRRRAEGVNLEALAKRLDGPGIADYELDVGIAQEAAAALRECAAVLRDVLDGLAVEYEKDATARAQETGHRDWMNHSCWLYPKQGIAEITDVPRIRALLGGISDKPPE